MPSRVGTFSIGDPDYLFCWSFNGLPISKSSSLVIYVDGGIPPYTWEVSGSGFSLENAETEVQYNTLIADGTVEQGDVAVITVRDSYESDNGIVSLFEFNSAGWLSDSIGSNDLTETDPNSKISNNTSDQKIGTGCVSFATSSLLNGGRLHRTNANLSSDFPFKDGTSNKSITAGLWVKLDNTNSSVMFGITDYLMVNETITAGVLRLNAFIGDDDDEISTGDLPQDEWLAVVVTYDHETHSGAVYVYDENKDLVDSVTSGSLGITAPENDSDFLITGLWPALNRGALADELVISNYYNDVDAILNKLFEVETGNEVEGSIICCNLVSATTCCTDGSYYFNIQNKVMRLGHSIAIGVNGGCPPFTWEILTGDFTLDQEITNTRTNIVTSYNSVNGTIQVTDVCNNIVEGTLTACSLSLEELIAEGYVVAWYPYNLGWEFSDATLINGDMTEVPDSPGIHYWLSTYVPPVGFTASVNAGFFGPYDPPDSYAPYEAYLYLPVTEASDDLPFRNDSITGYSFAARIRINDLNSYCAAGIGFGVQVRPGGGDPSPSLNGEAVFSVHRDGVPEEYYIHFTQLGDVFTGTEVTIYPDEWYFVAYSMRCSNDYLTEKVKIYRFSTQSEIVDVSRSTPIECSEFSFGDVPSWNTIMMEKTRPNGQEGTVTDGVSFCDFIIFTCGVSDEVLDDLRNGAHWELI